MLEKQGDRKGRDKIICNIALLLCLLGKSLEVSKANKEKQFPEDEINQSEGKPVGVLVSVSGLIFLRNL